MGPRGGVVAAWAVVMALFGGAAPARVAAGAARSGAGAAPTCRLDAFTPEQAARYHELVASLREGTLERKELRDGWAFRLVADETHFLQAAEWIALERRCCSFFRFELAWAGEPAPLWVRVRGSRAAKELLAEAWSADDSRQPPP